MLERIPLVYLYWLIRMITIRAMMITRLDIVGHSKGIAIVIGDSESLNLVLLK
jgi:hypothetical protein